MNEEDNEDFGDAWDEVEGEEVMEITKPFSILEMSDIKTKFDSTIQSCMDLFNISRDDTILALIFYNWNVEKLESDWFGKQDNIRAEAGAPAEESKLDFDGDCPICFELALNTDKLKCGHRVCIKCWSQEIVTIIGKGVSSINSKCPYVDCNIRIPPSIFRNYLNDADYRKYEKYLLNSFVDNNKKLRWCPGKNCNRIIEILGTPITEVTCSCKEKFCFNCGDSIHTPATCDMYKKWLDKINLEGDTGNWLAMHTKLCPKCKALTEKNTGCNHMTCTICKYEYCWVCLENWGPHIKDYGCNKINKDLWNQQDNTQNEVQRYMFYFTRYENHMKSIEHSYKLKEELEEFINLLTQTRNIPLSDAVFLTDSLRSLVEARKALKNSYIFAFYLKNATQAQLLEFTQKDLEMNCELCQELLEKDKDDFLISEDPENKNFFKYKSELVVVANVILKFYKNFISGILQQFSN